MAATQSIVPKSKLLALAPRWVGLLGLGLFSVPIFFLALPWLGLYNDDWFFLQTIYSHWQRLFIGWGAWTRPVGGLAWMTARVLFGTYIPGYYLILSFFRLEQRPSCSRRC